MEHIHQINNEYSIVRDGAFYYLWSASAAAKHPGLKYGGLVPGGFAGPVLALAYYVAKYEGVNPTPARS